MRREIASWRPRAQVSYPLVTGADGQAELRPGDIERAVASVFEKTLKAWRKTKSPAPIAGIGVSCFWHSLLGLDASGTRDHAYLYVGRFPLPRGGEAASRKRAARSPFMRGRVAWRARRFGPRNCSGYGRSSPALFRKVARWVSPAEWIQETWCGASTASLSMASGTGLLDGHTLKWHFVFCCGDAD